VHDRPVPVPDPAAAATTSKRPAWAYWLIAALLAAAAAAGASSLAFLCDDAFIHFRYAANAHAGHGLVWNPAPFVPVEGYGFLWVVVLWATWSWFGVEPPDAANALSIGFGLLQIGMLAVAARGLADRSGRTVSWVVGIAALAAIVGNRTFLQWFTGGLDTALFNLWLVGWVLWAFRPGARSAGAPWLGAWSGLAALAALTRPDGLTLVAATVAVAGWQCWRRALSWRGLVGGLLPLLVVAAHAVWRRSFYGEWLPNTYFAKVVAGWPEAGARYFACFALENGAWTWFPIAAAAAWVALRRHGARACGQAVLRNGPAVLAVGVVLFNTGYYLFRVGGDHFEYRVLSPLVPLATLACVAMAARLSAGPRLPLAIATGLLLAGATGWAHLAVTRQPAAGPGGVLLVDRLQAVTPHAPAFLKPLTRWFDRQQLWLWYRYICLRCENHARLLDGLRRRHPHRRHLGEQAGPFPIRAESAVGVPGWVLPDCNFIDVFGLNDRVVARTPVVIAPEVSKQDLARHVLAADREGDGILDQEELRDALGYAFGVRPDDGYGMQMLQLFWSIWCDDDSRRVTIAQAVEIGSTISFARRMAHERSPPPGYVESFEPNVEYLPDGEVVVRPRAVPMTAERIRQIEAEWWRKVQEGRR
jgi:arabinofuranosyltransferase